MSNKYPQNKTSHTSTESAATFKRRANYSFALQRAKLNLRRAEAEERQEYHNGLTIQERIAKAKKRRGNSKRELERLTAMLATAPKAPAKKKEKTS